MAKIMDGRIIAGTIRDQIAGKVKAFGDQGWRSPHLAIILIGDDGASRTYVNGKINACKEVGFDYSLFQFAETISQHRLLSHIDLLNHDPDIDGFIIQLPMPPQICVESITNRILPAKDVDGFTNQNFGSIVSRKPLLLPATPYAVMELLRGYKIKTKGKYCVIVGASRIVGAPLSLILSQDGLATVTVCHKHTRDLSSYTLRADILVVAAGKPNLVDDTMVKEESVVIDVGTTRVEDPTKKGGYSLQGDVNFQKVEPMVSHISPVPGGVGPLTVASLLLNTLKTYESCLVNSQKTSPRSNENRSPEDTSHR